MLLSASLVFLNQKIKVGSSIYGKIKYLFLTTTQ